MATAKQIELFRKLTNDRDLGPRTAMDELREKFATLSDRNASAWIERALDRPRREEGNEQEELLPAPF